MRHFLSLIAAAWLCSCVSGPAIVGPDGAVYTTGGTFFGKRENVVAEVPTPWGPMKYATSKETGEEVAKVGVAAWGIAEAGAQALSQANHTTTNETTRVLGAQSVQKAGIAADVEKTGIAADVTKTITKPK